jgi:hypothetical protein
MVSPDGSLGRRPARQNEPRRVRGNLTVFITCEIHSGRPECFQRHPAEGQRSHDWHVQPVVKDRTAVRLSGAFQSSPAIARTPLPVLETCFNLPAQSREGENPTNLARAVAACQRYDSGLPSRASLFGAAKDLGGDDSRRRASLLAHVTCSR